MELESAGFGGKRLDAWVLDFGANVLLAGGGLSEDGCILEDAANGPLGSSGGIGKLARVLSVD